MSNPVSPRPMIVTRSGSQARLGLAPRPGDQIRARPVHHHVQEPSTPSWARQDAEKREEKQKMQLAALHAIRQQLVTGSVFYKHDNFKLLKNKRHVRVDDKLETIMWDKPGHEIDRDTRTMKVADLTSVEAGWVSKKQQSAKHKAVTLTLVFGGENSQEVELEVLTGLAEDATRWVRLFKFLLMNRGFFGLWFPRSASSASLLDLKTVWARQSLSQPAVPGTPLPAETHPVVPPPRAPQEGQERAEPPVVPPPTRPREGSLSARGDDSEQRAALDSPSTSVKRSRRVRAGTIIDTTGLDSVPLIYAGRCHMCGDETGAEQNGDVLCSKCTAQYASWMDSVDLDIGLTEWAAELVIQPASAHEHLADNVAVDPETDE